MAEKELKEYTFSDVSEHATKKDIFVVIHDKVYNPTEFIDEHPGGEEVLLDVAGTDATESFEDVGHSDEAREILETLLVGKLKRQEGDPPPPSAQPNTSTSTSSDAASFGITTYLLILGVVGAAYYAFQVMNADKKQ